MPQQLKIIMTLLFACATTPLYAQQPSLLDQIMQTQAAIVDIKAKNNVGFQRTGAQAAINPATGQVVVLRNMAAASYERKGAGVVIHPVGIIVTNAHIVAKAQAIEVILPDRTAWPATVVRFINDLDIALLKIEASREFPYVALANSDQIQLGEEIMTVGSSPLLSQTITGGKVIGLGVNRSLEAAGHRRTDLIQTTVNLYEGDSGGPLFNRKGELIGLMTAKETAADHSSFAIPSNKIAETLQDYLNELQAPNP